MEGLGQVMAFTGNGDMAFLHSLQQGGLGARAGAIDFVGHQQATEDRTGQEAEMAFAIIGFLEDFRAENIGRHQIGRELDAFGLQTGRHRDGLDQARLGKAWGADQQGVTA